MCIISDKIKFCTCTNQSAEKLKHYWILYRFTKEKNEMCVGEPMMPTYMSDMNFEENQSALEKRLNEPDAFDVPIIFQSKDQLEIVINNNNSSFSGIFTFTFEFKKNKWVAIETDPFYLMNHYNEKKSGKIKNALKRKK